MSEYSDTQTEKNIFTDTEEEYFREERGRQEKLDWKERMIVRERVNKCGLWSIYSNTVEHIQSDRYYILPSQWFSLRISFIMNVFLSVIFILIFDCKHIIHQYFK